MRLEVKYYSIISPFCDRILYADLEFYPEEKFSVPAKLLLGGLIKRYALNYKCICIINYDCKVIFMYCYHYSIFCRDPATRLGAWENPPTDIMTSPFFSGTDWEAIYEKKTDGPYVPEIPTFAKRNGTSTKNGKIASVSTGDAATVQPMDGCDSPMANPTKTPNKLTNENSSKIDEDEGDELTGMRDSLFIRSKEGGNALPDWSFIDEQVLRASMKPEPGEEGGLDEVRGDQKSSQEPSLTTVPEI